MERGGGKWGASKCNLKWEKRENAIFPFCCKPRSHISLFSLPAGLAEAELNLQPVFCDIFSVEHIVMQTQPLVDMGALWTSYHLDPYFPHWSHYARGIDSTQKRSSHFWTVFHFFVWRRSALDLPHSKWISPCSPSAPGGQHQAISAPLWACFAWASYSMCGVV